MRYLALCCDYDGTIAHDGRIDEPTLDALKRLRSSGRKLLLVTGRELEDLRQVCTELDLFDCVVAENGALVHYPASREERLLGPPPTAEFLEQLAARNVAPLSVGRVIVATWQPQEYAVLEAIRECGLELQVIFNKGAVMVLPAGINKASGLKAALREMNISVHNVVGIGDAENDHAFLSICECSVAVANALPAIKKSVDLVMSGSRGAGVAQLIVELVADDLAARATELSRHEIALGKDRTGAPVTLSPYQTSALIVGPSGRGKSTVAAGLIERLRAADYTYCIIDPEGDYDAIESTLVLGGPAYVPTIDECVQLLGKPEQNLVINLLGLKLDERPWFFLALLARIRDLRARTGRPHWLLIDEAHHMMPADWKPCDEIIPAHLQGIVMVSVRPALIARSVLRALDTLVVVGDRLEEMLPEFAERESCVNATVPDWQEGEALLWSRTRPGAATVVRLQPSRTQRRRHLRKYAQGELPRDRSFYFRGADGRLNLRAHNLFLFLDMADGVDDETWLFHLRRGEISRWLRDGLKDEELAGQVAAVEQGDGVDAANSRRQIRQLIETLYTAPAGAGSAGS